MLSVLIPIYNEVNTVELLIKKVFFQKKFFKIQIIVVDDGSTDGSVSKLKYLKKRGIIDILILKRKNSGKGSAIHMAIKFAKEKYSIIQDADLEYDPFDYKKMLNLIQKKNLKVLYGSRLHKENKKSYFTSSYRIFGNKFLTSITNFLYNQNLTDAHTCYKMFCSKILKKITLKEKGFGFCPEITAKISKLGFEIKEVPIKYYGRNVKQGKKINFTDGFEAIKVLLKNKIND